MARRTTLAALAAAVLLVATGAGLEGTAQ